MRYAIFSTNPNCNQEPYVFTVDENGSMIWKPAVYSLLEVAKRMCARMNEGNPGAFVVRDAKTREVV